MLQKLPNNSIQDTESQPNREYEEYVKVVADVLEAYYAHSLRNLPENFGTIVANWANLFIKAGIPASQLMDVYLEAHVNLEKGEYFNADTIIATWNDRRIQRLQEARRNEVCTVCKGTKTTLKYDFKLEKDVKVDCPKCV